MMGNSDVSLFKLRFWSKISIFMQVFIGTEGSTVATTHRLNTVAKVRHYCRITGMYWGC